MRSALCKRKLNRLLLAAVAAGALSVPVVSAQSSTATTPKKPAHKTSHPSSSHPATSHSSTTHKAASHSTTTHPSAAHSSSTTSASKKSAKATTSRRRSKTKKVKGQAAPTSDRINEIQEALAKKGVFDGTPSGSWDDSTVNAMKRFQSNNGLNPTGKLDALTLQKLGLGSETAGIAAPILPPNASNRLINTTSAPEPTTN
jgi:murein L,D-transpeptidase YcbB/YkuD